MTLAANSPLRPQPTNSRRYRAAPSRLATAWAAAVGPPTPAPRQRLPVQLRGQTLCLQLLLLSGRRWNSCGMMCRPNWHPFV